MLPKIKDDNERYNGNTYGWEDMVPWEWRDIICCCYPGSRTDSNVPRIDQRCLRCNRIARYHFARCTTCREPYVTLFVHPEAKPASVAKPPYGYDVGSNYIGYNRDKARHGYCYSCLTKEFGEPEGCIPPPNVQPKTPRSLDELFAVDLGEFESFSL